MMGIIGGGVCAQHYLPVFTLNDLIIRSASTLIYRCRKINQSYGDVTGETTGGEGSVADVKETVVPDTGPPALPVLRATAR